MRKFALAAFCFVATLASAAQSKWTIVDLGALGPTGSFATAVNERGDVVGQSTVRVPGQSDQTHAFLWQDGTMVDLGTPAGSTASFAVAINNSGTVAGQDANGNAYTWKDGTWTSLGVHGGPADIDNSGTVAGTYGAGQDLRSYVLRKGAFTDIGTLGGASALAAAMNNAGAIVGNADVPGNNSHAFLYSRGAMVDLGTLGGGSSTAVDINDGGVVVGASQDASGHLKGFIYDNVQGMRALFDYPGTFYAAGINDRGDVLGFIDSNSFLYSDGVLTRLESIPEVRAAGWTQLFPFDINNRGWIVGMGTRAGSRFNTAFLLVPK
jgi:probable HAF family extracellular repeat protein